MQCLEVSGAVRPMYGSLDVKRLIIHRNNAYVAIIHTSPELDLTVQIPVTTMCTTYGNT